MPHRKSGGVQSFPRGPGKISRSVETLQEAYGIKGLGGVPGEIRTDGGIYLHHEMGAVLGRERATQNVEDSSVTVAPGATGTVFLNFPEPRRVQWATLDADDGTLGGTAGFAFLQLDSPGGSHILHHFVGGSSVAPAGARDYLPNSLRNLPYPFLLESNLKGMGLRATFTIDPGAAGNITCRAAILTMRTEPGLPIPA